MSIGAEQLCKGCISELLRRKDRLRRKLKTHRPRHVPQRVVASDKSLSLNLSASLFELPLEVLVLQRELADAAEGRLGLLVFLEAEEESARFWRGSGVEQ